MTKAMKSSILVIMLCLITFLFSACASVNATTITNEDGSIDELVTVLLDIDKIASSQYNIDDLRKDVDKTSQNLAMSLIEDFNLRLLNEFNSTEDSNEREKLASYQNGISTLLARWVGNKYSFGLRFKNKNVYRYYYNITEDNSVKPEMESHFLYTKVTYNFSNDYAINHDLFDVTNEYYSAKYPELIENSNPRLTYTYTADYRREHSNADEISLKNGKYYHTWVIEDIDEPISVYYNIANKSNCILVCIGITLGITIILGGIVVAINKKRNR